MSREVWTPLLIAAGVIGVPVAFSLTRCTPEKEVLVDELPPAANAETVYPNNYFQTGRGYYHAPFYSWFPQPFGFYDANRGWYRGGVWRRAAQADDVEQREAMQRQTAAQMQARRQAQTSGFAPRGTTMGSSGGLSRSLPSSPSAPAVQRSGGAAPSAAPASHAAPVMRGGFGLSSHPSIS